MPSGTAPTTAPATRCGGARCPSRSCWRTGSLERSWRRSARCSMARTCCATSSATATPSWASGLRSRTRPSPPSTGWEPGYQVLIRDDTRPQGVDALFEAVGLRDRDRHGVVPAADAADDGVDVLDSHEYWAGLDAEVAGTMLDRLSTQAGGRDALFALTEDPLPEEPWPLPPAVPEDIARQAEVAGLCGDRLHGLPDPELGAACRQLLAAPSRAIRASSGGGRRRRARRPLLGGRAGA